MITDKGKAVISKYLIGQSPAYASYIAIGCGPSPVVPGTALNLTTLKTKTSMDFEMARFPITSKGYVTEDGVSKLVLTAQIPADGRYGITEVGIFPAVSNPVAVNNDSRMLLNFQPSEQWLYKNYSAGTQDLVAESVFATTGGDINTVTAAFFANSFDAVLQNQTRTLNNEIPRNGEHSIIIPGNMTTFTSNVPSGGSYLVLSNPGIDLSLSSPNDQLKIAFSVLSNTLSATLSGSAKIIIEFGSSDAFGSGTYARTVVDVDIADTSSDTKRYFTKSVNVKDIQASPGFSWSTAKYVKIGVAAGSNVTIALDGLRVDNVSSLSPVYGLVGYTIIKNSLAVTSGTEEAVPVVKEKDKTSFIEFRFQASVI